MTRASDGEGKCLLSGGNIAVIRVSESGERVFPVAEMEQQIGPSVIARGCFRRRGARAVGREFDYGEMKLLAEKKL